MSARPLRHRLAVVVLGVVAGTVVATGVAVHGAMARALESNLDLALSSVARTEVASAVDDPSGGVHLHDPLSQGAAPGYEKLAHIEDAHGRLVAATDNLAGRCLPLDPGVRARALAGETVCVDAALDGHPLRVLAQPISGGRHGRLVMVVALSRRPLDSAMALLRRILFFVAALAILGALIATRALAAHVAQPLERIAAAAAAVGVAGAAVRMPVTGTDREVDELAESIDGMLARLDVAFAAERNLAESQRRFVADASHELRTPLANLRASMEVALRRERDPSEYRATLAAGVAEVERLSRLVDALLTLGRADAGRLDLDCAPCDAVELARASADASSARAVEAGVTLELTGAATAPLTADAGRLRQVLDNLVDNALRHAPRGTGVVLDVEARDREVAITVSDAGPGLAPEMRDRVFERFARAEPSRARASGGAGLGLAIARALVIAHGGTIAALPRERGAAFEVRLPA